MNFEFNLSLVLSHTVLLEHKNAVQEPIGSAFYLNGGAPAPGTSESMDSVLKAYGSNLPKMVQAQIAAAQQYEPAMQKMREEISPREQQLNLDLYNKYGSQFAKTGSDIARQNAQSQAETDLGIVSGTGRDLVREAMKTQREADPEAYRARELALSNLERYNKSLTDPDAGVSGAEQAEIDRSLARDNYSKGIGANPTSTSTVSNAMAFGRAGEERRGQRQSAIANAAQMATGAVQPLSSKIDTFQLTTGRPAINQGEGRSGGAREVGADTNAMGQNMFSSASQMRQQENDLNSKRKSAMDNIMQGTQMVGGICCWTFAEAYYGWDNIPDDVRVSRDLHYTPQRREGYRMMSSFLVPKMSQSSIWRFLVNFALIYPMAYHAKWYVNRKGIGWIFDPLQKLYLTIWEYYGERAGIPVEAYNLLLAKGPWNFGIYRQTLM